MTEKSKEVQGKPQTQLTIKTLAEIEDAWFNTNKTDKEKLVLTQWVSLDSLKPRIQRLYDIFVAHIEADDHQLDDPYYFRMILTKEEKDEFGSILKELLGKKP